MKKYIKYLVALLLGFLVAYGTSAYVENGRPEGYVAPEFSCKAADRNCVGDYLYGWPFSSHSGFSGDYTTMWLPYLCNIVFWSLISLAALLGIAKIFRQLKK